MNLMKLLKDLNKNLAQMELMAIQDNLDILQKMEEEVMTAVMHNLLLE